MDSLYFQTIIDRIISLSLAILAALLAVGLILGLVYLVIIYLRLKKREEISLEMLTLEVKLQKDNEIKIDAA